MPCYCYILECADGSLYTGWSTDPVRRTKAHNAGRGARYTRSRRPVRLVFVELEETRSAAMKREMRIKSMPRSTKRRLIETIKKDVDQIGESQPESN
jgi:putative endonuclease